MYFAHTYRTNHELYSNHMTDHMWTGSWTALIWMLLWLTLIVVVIIAGLSYIRSSQSKSDPLNELKNRYAKGEIDKKEYASIKKDLLKN